MSNMLVDQILSYMSDSSARYAICLEGVWGSGKTRFCEGELKEALANHEGQKYSMLRVSLFGVADAEALYARIATALAHVGISEADGRMKRCLKSLGDLALRGMVSAAEKKADDLGVNIEVSPQILSSALGEGQLLILDDFERNKFGKDRMFELYGAVNSLVEGQNCKVMFVTNDYSAMDGDLREKLVWRCHRFEPHPADLVKTIIVPVLPHDDGPLGFDAVGCVCQAAVDARCANARAMIKAAPLIGMALGTNALGDSTVDVANREAALCDFARFSLRTAMGRAPQRPAEPEDGEHFDTKRYIVKKSYDQYTQLHVIGSYFGSKRGVSVEDVDACLARYTLANYAGSPETMRMRRLLERSRCSRDMEDDEVAALAEELSHCLLHTEFDLAHLCDAVQLSWTLRNWGFEEAACEEDLVARVRELAAKDPQGVYSVIHGRYTLWREEWAERYGGLMTSLDALVVEAYESWRAEGSSHVVDPDDPNAGKRLADAVQEGWRRGEELFLSFSPRLVAECFARGNAANQMALCEMTEALRSGHVARAGSGAVDWVRSLHGELERMNPASRMGRVRKRWALEDLRKIVGDAPTCGA